MVAFVIKYADSVVKGFAASISIVICSGVSWVFFGMFESVSGALCFRVKCLDNEISPITFLNDFLKLLQ